MMRILNMMRILKRIAVTFSALALLLACVGGIRADVTRHALKGQKNVPIDLGVDTATVKTLTALYTNPDTSSAKIAVLRSSDLIVLVSREEWMVSGHSIQFGPSRVGNSK